MGEGYNDEDGPNEAEQLPAADDRLWRHPAEQGALQAAANLQARRSYRRIWPSVFMSFVAGCCVVGLAWMLVDSNQQVPIAEVVVQEVALEEIVFEGTLSFDDWVNDVSQLNRSSVVSVRIPRGESVEVAQAILLRDDGHLITSAEVVAGADEVGVEYAGGQLPAQIIGSDPISGIAVLKINSPNLTPPTFGDESRVVVGDRLVALSYAGGTDEPARAVDLIGKGHVATSTGGTPLSELFSLTNELDEQWAGSALLSEDGGIVAITVPSANGGSYAVPISLARRVADQLIADGTVNHKTWIGVEMSAALSDSLKEERGVRGGLLLTRVWDETPAARAGLVAGDIIVRAGSVNVFDRTDFFEALAVLEPGDTMEITYSRSAPSVQISAVLESPAGEPVEPTLFTTTVILGARPA